MSYYFARPRFVLAVILAALTWLAAFVFPACARAQVAPSFNKSIAGSAKKTAPPLDTGAESAGVYRNATFGFTCRIPPAWVLRTEEMNAENEYEASDAAKSTNKSGRVLLAVFSRPPEAHGEDVNALILIAAESVSAYPGLANAAQYFGPVSEIARAQGFQVAEEPYEFILGTKTLVREDFQKDVGPLVMRQSTLAMLAHSYAVSFTFIGGAADQVEELIKKLSFSAATKPPGH